MALSDLYLLGPCLASTLPTTYLQSISPSTFVSYFSTLGNSFQPDANQTQVVQQIIASYASNQTLMANSSQSTLLFTILSDLAIFYPFSTYASNITSVFLIFYQLFLGATLEDCLIEKIKDVFQLLWGLNPFSRH